MDQPKSTIISALITGTATLLAVVVAAFLHPEMVGNILPIFSKENNTVEQDNTTDREADELRTLLDDCYNRYYASSCVSAGVMIGDGKGKPIDLEESADLYKKGCDWDNGRGCYNYALRLARGKGVPKNESEAEFFFEKACEFNHSKACKILYGYLD